MFRVKGLGLLGRGLGYMGGGGGGGACQKDGP